MKESSCCMRRRHFCFTHTLLSSGLHIFSAGFRSELCCSSVEVTLGLVVVAVGSYFFRCLLLPGVPVSLEPRLVV